jgi:integrase
MPKSTCVEIPAEEQAWMLAALRRARSGYPLALHILLGYLQGKQSMRRVHPNITPIVAALALLLGYLCGPCGGRSQLRIIHAKREADRYVPFLPALVDELRRHLQERQTGFLCESNRQTRHSTRTVQSLVTDCPHTAAIEKRMYSYLLRHSMATILLDSGVVPIDQSKF